MPDREVNSTTFMTLPNLVSCSRVALIPAFGWAIVNNNAALSIGLFSVVVMSDILDGIIARRTGQETRLGTLLDHGADATFIVSVTALFAWLGLLPWLLPPLIALAFIQYVLDSHVFTGANLRPSLVGRWNGIAYFVFTGGAIFVHHFSTDPGVVLVLRGCGWLLAGTTVVSIAQRAIHFMRTRSGL
jgi:phosphatidylglycerophosphate synthase